MSQAVIPGLMRRSTAAISIQGVSDLPAGSALGGVPRRLLVWDVAAATVLGVLLVVSALSPAAHRALSAPVWVGIAVAVVAAAAVAVRRLAPFAALAVAVGASVMSYLLGFERDSFLTAGLVLYLIASARPPAESARAGLAAAAATIATFALAPPPVSAAIAAPGWWRGIGGMATALAVQAAAWALGLAVYRQRGYLAAVRAQASQRIRAQQELSGRALAEERLRIARELHDVVAHAMSVIAVQAGVARHVLAVRPGQASSALAAIEETGRQALRDMRQLLGVLRDSADETPRTPTPGLADLEELISRTDAAGTAVELLIRGDARPLPDGIELSAYRIVQEALTNTVKHARTDHARVVLSYRARDLAIEITDDGAGGASQAAGGHGITGMRERAALHGGTLTAGPLPLRGYRVAASIPLDQAEAAS
jgi:signal transduction histidine kinase